MKIIFLDVDGVLNSHNTLIKRGGQPRIDMHEEHVEVLRWIIEKTSAKIVVSSTWRLHAGLEGMRDYLEKFGIDRKTIIGVTPTVIEDDPKHERYKQRAWRGKEIQEWMDRTKEEVEVERFVIIDDESDMAHLKEHLFQTTWKYGLTYCEGADIVCYLNEHYWYPNWSKNPDKKEYDIGPLLNHER